MNLVESGARIGGATPYRFDDIVVDPAAHTVLRAGAPQPLEPKAFAVLLALLQRPGELISRDELLDRVWGHRHVTPGVLTRAIAQLRHALDDPSHEPRYIQTRHALGYSFIGVLRDDEAVVAPTPEMAEPSSAGSEAAADEPGEPSELPANTSAHQFAFEAVARSDSAPMALSRPKYGRWVVLTLLLLAALTVWRMAGHGKTPPVRSAASIAVLPFVSLSSDRNDAYFADGLAEEMRDALAGVPGLKVAASISPAAQNTMTDAKALGAKLGVATILDASVRRDGSRLRITAHLSDTSTGFTLWSHTYDRELSDVFDTQSDIAKEVVHALLGAMPGSTRSLTKRLTPTRNEAAFDIYLQGLQLLRSASRPDDAEQAIARFNQALKQDSGFALAQAGICRAEIWRFEGKHDAQAFDRARQACQRAAQMDPTLAQVDLALGDLYRAAGDADRALLHYRISARAPQMRVSAHLGMAKVYAEQGRHDLAMKEFQQALALSPDDASVHAEIGYQQYLDGKPADAVASYRQAVKLQPENADLWGTLGALYMEAGNNTEAASALERAIAIAPAADTLTNLGLLRYMAGDYAAAVALQRQATTLDPDDFMTWGNLADALRADPAASAADVHAAFEQAAGRAERYLKVKPDDARAVASLAFYRVVLGAPASALMLVQRSESLPGQPGEVALLNAETLALLGEIGQARQQLAAARAAGIAETLITSNLTFRRLGLLTPPGATPKSTRTEPHSPHSVAGHPAGE